MASSRRTSQDELEIKTTVMAIREELMQYFKGGCVQKLTSKTNVKMRSNIPTNLNYSYERREYEMHRPSMLWIGSVPILTLERTPDKIVFHKMILSRSKQLRQVMDELDEFTQTYLRAVERSYEDATIVR